MSENKMDKIVKTYLKIRDEKNRLTKAYEARDKELAADLASIEQVLLTSCNDIGADSIRTELGTIIKSTKESFPCGS